MAIRFSLRAHFTPIWSSAPRSSTNPALRRSLPHRRRPYRHSSGCVPAVVTSVWYWKFREDDHSALHRVPIASGANCHLRHTDVAFRFIWWFGPGFHLAIYFLLASCLSLSGWCPATLRLSKSCFPACNRNQRRGRLNQISSVQASTAPLRQAERFP